MASPQRGFSSSDSRSISVGFWCQSDVVWATIITTCRIRLSVHVVTKRFLRRLLSLTSSFECLSLYFQSLVWEFATIFGNERVHFLEGNLIVLLIIVIIYVDRNTNKQTKTKICFRFFCLPLVFLSSSKKPARGATLHRLLDQTCQVSKRLFL